MNAERFSSDGMDGRTTENRIMFLEKRIRKLGIYIALLAVLWVISGAAMGFSRLIHKVNPGAMFAGEVLHVRGLIVKDDHGITRLQIGAPLPDPPLLGKRLNRNGTAHGILLFDKEGNERSGYVTMDESNTVMVTLDEVARMVALFAAGPAGGVRLMMRDAYGNDLYLGTFEEGPYLSMKNKTDSLLLRPERNGKGEKK